MARLMVSWSMLDCVGWAHHGLIVAADDEGVEWMDSSGGIHHAAELLADEGFDTTVSPPPEEVLPPEQERVGLHVWEGKMWHEETGACPRTGSPQYLLTVEGSWRRPTQDELEAVGNGRLPSWARPWRRERSGLEPVLRLVAGETDRESIKSDESDEQEP